MSTPAEPLWTVKDLAAYLNISPGTIRNRMSLARTTGATLNLPPAVYIGSSLRFRPEDARAFVAGCVEKGAA